jgi:hypothetical protein
VTTGSLKFDGIHTGINIKLLCFLVLHGFCRGIIVLKRAGKPFNEFQKLKKNVGVEIKFALSRYVQH